MKINEGILEKTTEDAEPIDGKIKAKEKAAYFCANIGNIPIMTIIGSYLLIFYTDVVKLDPIAVGVLFLVARIVDAVCDPFMGFAIDHLPRQKMGRFRPWLIIGALICSANFVFLWLGPSLAPTGKLIIAYISYILLGPTFASMDISLNSMIPVMTSVSKERNTLATIKGFAYIIGAVVFMTIVVPFVSLFQTPMQGYNTLIVIVAVFIFGMSALGSLGIRERVEPIKKDRYSGRTMFKIIFQTKPLAILYVAMLFVSAGISIRQGSMMYYATYNMHNAGLMVLLSLTTVVGSAISLAFMPSLTKKFDKKYVALGAFFIMGIGCLLLLFIPYDNIPGILGSMVFASLGMVGTLALTYAFQADVVDYVELKHGYRAEAIVVSFHSFLSKLAQALGGAIPAFILSFTGYVAGAANQSAGTLQGINFSMSVIPSIFILIGAFMFIAYPLTRGKFMDVTQKLVKKRDTAGEA